MAARPVVDFTKPDTVVTVTIDPATGLPANMDCPEKLDEVYIAGTQPTGSCPAHGGAPVNQVLPPPLPLPLPNAVVPPPDNPPVDAVH